LLGLHGKDAVVCGYESMGGEYMVAKFRSNFKIETK
jgi:hypothetical protein